MKKTGVYIQSAIMSTFMRYYTTKDLADKVVEIYGSEDREFQVFETRASSIIFRKKRDCTITENKLAACIVKGMRSLISSDTDTFISDINDRYEFEYYPELINDEFVEEFFTIVKSQKHFYVDIDFG